VVTLAQNHGLPNAKLSKGSVRGLSVATSELERPITSERDLSASTTMKALVYRGPGKRAWEDRPRPVIRNPADAVVRITTSTICGTDIHILKGDLPSVVAGRILGHEGIGVIEEVGTAVSEFRVGERVIISCITACLKCVFCKRAMYSHCSRGGWILGCAIDGTQAEYVRIPYADGSLYHFPPGGDEEALVMLSDILPTGFECGVSQRASETRGHDRYRGCRAGRASRSADRTILFTSDNHNGRSGRQAAGNRQDIRRNRWNQ
jgi:hypothetical protein